MKSKNIKFIFLISIFLLIPLVLAYNYQINVDSNYEVFNTDIYKCSDSGCSNITFHQSSTNGQYSLIGSGSNYYAEYDYKSCFKPHIYRLYVWGDLSGTENYNIIFNKKENCQGEINTGELSENNINLGETVTITSNVHSGFEYPVEIPETTAIPDNIKDEYSTNTKLSIYANDIKIGEAEAEILLASDKDFSFGWTPSSAGIYEITAKSEIIDCACSSQETQEFLIGTLIVNEPPQECCVDSDCTADYYSNNSCSNNDVYKDYHDFFCLVGFCNENITKILVTDCGNDEYGNWSNYCQGNDIYKQRYYAHYGCLSGGCFVGTVVQHEFVENCTYDCVNGECINEPEHYCGDGIVNQGWEECDDGNNVNEDGCDSNCKIEIIPCCSDEQCPADYYSSKYCENNNVYWNLNDWFCKNGTCSLNVIPELFQDCGNESYSDNYCKNKDVYKNHIIPGCSAGTCNSATIEEIVENCTYGCSNEICNPAPECSTDSDCTADYYSDNYCTNGDVYKDFHNFSCLIGECKEEITKELVKECDHGCKNGECKADGNENTWCIETNSCELTFDDSTAFDNSITLKSIENNQTFGSIILNTNNSGAKEPISYFWVFVFVIAIIIILILLFFLLI